MKVDIGFSVDVPFIISTTFKPYNCSLNLAESEGFEPPVPQAVQQISSLPRSTSLPTLRIKGKSTFIIQSPKIVKEKEKAIISV